MDYRTLGRSGCAVSVFALGTVTFGVETGEQEAHRQLDRFVDAGGTLVDTASDPGAPDCPYGELGAEQRSRGLAGGS